MKRKKWSEAEEKSLLTKYADLVNAGTLAKLKTREKKFKPVADWVNDLHHHRDPIAFPFKWSWRDVSIKVQNMRHQYLGVKQKIRLSGDRFNWDDGDSHWENFLKYKEVFGDVELQVKDSDGDDGDESCQDLGLGFEIGDSADDDDVTSDQHRVEGIIFHRTGRELGLLGGRVLELRCGVMRMEERKRQREFEAEEGWSKERRNALLIDELHVQREHEAEMRVVQEEEREMEWEKRQLERWMRADEEVENERLRRIRMEAKREEEEMEWKEKILRMQIEHEKTMLRMYSNACQNQIQIIGVFGRLLCHLFGSGSDSLGAYSISAQANMPDAKPDSSSQSPERLETLPDDF